MPIECLAPQHVPELLKRGNDPIKQIPILRKSI